MVIFMKLDEFTLPATDGHNIYVRCWKPSRRTPQGIVQIAHGMAEHSARYSDTAQQLCQAGFIVFAHDHRGHGRSKNSSGAGLYAKKNGWSLVKSDLDIVQTHIAEHHSNLPIFLLGHSMGSFITMSYLVDSNPKLAGVMLSGSNFDHPIRYRALKPIIKAEKLRAGKTGTSRFIEYLTFGSFNNGILNPATPFDWLSTDSNEVEKYIKDEDCGFLCTNQLWDDLTDGLISISSNRELRKIESTLPIYLFAGCKDPVGGYSKGVRRLAHQLIGSGHIDVSCKLYPDGRHEMLNESNKTEVVDDLIAWMATKVRHQP